MTEIKIEKGVPMPCRKMGRAFKYPWLEMEIGDSFFVAATDAEVSSRRVLSVTASKRYAPRRFIARRVDGGIRIWRVEDVVRALGLKIVGKSQ